MERLSTNTVKALAFCLSSNSIRSRVHFFPSAGITTGPFTITCALTLFGKGVERKTVLLDGGRLGQPDGVRLEDAFPGLRSEATGLFGLEIQLSCQQPRVNLLSSQCAIEMVAPQFTVLYGVGSMLPVSLEVDEQEGASTPPSDLAFQSRRRAPSALGVADSYLCSSLVVVNSTSESIRPDAFRVEGDRATALQVGTVAAESAVEAPLDDVLFRDNTPIECAWGLVRTAGVHLATDSISSGGGASGVGYYILYRDAVSKRPISVCAL